MLNIKALDGRKLKKETGLNIIKKNHQGKNSFSFLIINKNDECFELSGHLNQKTGQVICLELFNHTNMLGELETRYMADIHVPLRMLNK